MQQFKLFDTLGFLTINTAFQAKQNLNSIFLRNGIDASMDQFVILSVLLINNGIVQKALSEQCCKSDSNITRILNVMENKELIERKKGKDARSRSIFITQKGTLLYQRLAPLAAAYNSQLFEGFSEEEIIIYRGLLMRMRENLMKREGERK
ncbi:MarR family winged helix-turn-helix transcriptional regulator [Lacrimispora sp.]|uniref:MarR family winged helix-turn-helix transcriptional regulator n=1 Tax=Lacrimispora sp. TaxID=2719234 RepID=UPI0028AD005F|nr:MarR family transcriptional regulator [Lacrimispora sp.]